MAGQISEKLFNKIAGETRQLIDVSYDRQELMNFGLASLDELTAYESGYIRKLEEFTPELCQTKIGGLLVCLEGNPYKTVDLRLALPGVRLPNPAWIGDIEFRSGDSYLKYGLRSAHSILMTRKTLKSKWTENMWADDTEAQSLLGAITEVGRQVGSKALVAAER